jgi:2-haloacid dehalogenase
MGGAVEGGRVTPPSRAVRAIVFDFGGVLVDWNPRYLYRKLFPGDDRAMERFLEEVGFAEWNVKQDLGRTFAEAVAELTGRFPQYGAHIRAYDERWEESIAGPIQASVEVLEALKRGGHELHGLSNWSSEKFRLTRAKFGFFGLFDSILVSGDVKLAKPDPRIFTLFLQRIGRPAQECLFIDDSAANVAAARLLGFETIHFKSAAQLQGELRSSKLLPD